MPVVFEQMAPKKNLPAREETRTARHLNKYQDKNPGIFSKEDSMQKWYQSQGTQNSRAQTLRSLVVGAGVVALLGIATSSVYAGSGSSTYGIERATYNQPTNSTFDEPADSWNHTGTARYRHQGTGFGVSGITSYQWFGNTLYGSDGTSCRTFGRTTYCD